jgi:AAA15 family ATPase/GTPase
MANAMHIKRREEANWIKQGKKVQGEESEQTAIYENDESKIVKEIMEENNKQNIIIQQQEAKKQAQDKQISDSPVSKQPLQVIYPHTQNQ